MWEGSGLRGLRFVRGLGFKIMFPLPFPFKAAFTDDTDDDDDY